MTKVVCLDTHILIWGVEQTARNTQQDMIERTIQFIDSLPAQKIKPIIPSVVLSEFLMPIPYEKKGLYLDSINQKLKVVPYDTIAAIEFVNIWQSKQDEKIIKKLREQGISKNHLKIDCMIVATAITRRASCIYSHDKGLKNFAVGHIDVKEIPELPSQQKITF
ncbi:PIN domain-containing protein [Candidatus Albibeggiatoa sp. nov. BB20]|uniref:type II toxin-antitoxin system VapC family toxin n=1 Tax=Candidatus Albibeggiatoa sp. nov. BB20 TaxID=3162723 RepID=UPI0033656D01